MNLEPVHRILALGRPPTPWNCPILDCKVPRFPTIHAPFKRSLASGPSTFGPASLFIDDGSSVGGEGSAENGTVTATGQTSISLSNPGDISLEVGKTSYIMPLSNQTSASVTFSLRGVNQGEMGVFSATKTLGPAQVGSMVVSYTPGGSPDPQTPLSCDLTATSSQGQSTTRVTFFLDDYDG